MANAFVQQKTIQSTSSVTSLTTSAMTVGAGNALASATCANADGSGAIPTLVTTDSQGDAFVPEIGIRADQNVQWELATGAVGGSTTFTVTPSVASFVSIAVQEYSGVAAFPVETTTTGHQTTQVATPGSLDAPSAGDLYLSAWTHAGAANQTFTPAAGWTLRSNLTLTANMPLGTCEFIGSGPQTGSCALSGGVNVIWDAAAMACRAADVAPPDDGDSPNFVGVDFPMADRGFGQ